MIVVCHLPAQCQTPCEKCNNAETEFKTRQLRSADEGQTVFFFCRKCGCGEFGHELLETVFVISVSAVSSVLCACLKFHSNICAGTNGGRIRDAANVLFSFAVKVIVCSKLVCGFRRRYSFQGNIYAAMPTE